MKIAAPTTIESVTFHAYIQAKAGVKMNEEQCEAFGRDVFEILRQIVLDNPFSIDTKLSFPRLQGDYSLPNLVAWCDQMQTWYSTLPRTEKQLLESIQFKP